MQNWLRKIRLAFQAPPHPQLFNLDAKVNRLPSGEVELIWKEGRRKRRVTLPREAWQDILKDVQRNEHLAYWLEATIHAGQ